MTGRPENPGATMMPSGPSFAPKPSGEGLKLHEVIATGGMGEILAARQTRLQRTVAVKRARRDVRGAQEALHREALLTAALEHPNIVPVHTLEDGEDDEDGPLMVMQHIEGSPWSELLADADMARAFLDGRDPLTMHLDILIATCNAIQFAHSRGIVHRDLKPANVMIGPFGEVYVLDWGLSVSLWEEDAERFPLARDINQPAGTPSYMSPELARGDGSAIDERTDVYLLGAILHVILTGQTRHPAGTIREALEAALVSEPVNWPADVPKQLAQVVDRATRAAPEERYATVDAFRTELVQWLRNRASYQLTQVALKRLSVLEMMVQGHLAGLAQDASTLSFVAVEGRFGFRQALERWPGNVEAHEGLQRLLELNIRFELSRDNPDSAGPLIDELAEPNPELDDLFQQSLARRAAQSEAAGRLADLEHDADLAVAAAPQGVAGCLIGAVAAAVCFSLGVADRLWTISYFAAVTGFVIFTIAAVLSTLVVSRMALNRASRQQLKMFLVMTLTLMCHWLGCAWLGLPITTAVAWNALLAAGMLAVTGAIFDIASALPALVYAATWAGILIFPGWTWEIFGVGNFVAYSAWSTWTSRRGRL